MAPRSEPAATPTLFDMVEDEKPPASRKSASKARRSVKPSRTSPAAPVGEPKAAGVQSGESSSAKSSRRANAEEMGARQREISGAEFFTKNRHLLGFDSPLKALLTAVKEAVDNSLDACEEAGILPEISVEIVPVSEDRFRMNVEDNGPGIVREQVAKVFGKLLYGSKFHKLSQSRGQQGIGISAAG